MKVWSMFNGCSGGNMALDRLGIITTQYVSSEIDKYANKVTNHNYPETIQVGDALNYNDWGVNNYDLALAGSPCQDLSRIKSKDGKGLAGDKSSLFYTFYAALEKYSPKYFLLENVVMNKEDEKIITKLLGIQPILIDSGLFSAQNRERLYWTNIPQQELPKSNNLVIKDIMQNDVDDKYYYKDREYTLNDPNKRIIANLKTHTKEGKRHFTDLTSRVYNVNHKCSTLTAVSGGNQEKKILDHKGIRKLTPLEYERLQTLPDGYTSMVSDSQRYKMLGNGWNIETIVHILKGLKGEYK